MSGGARMLRQLAVAAVLAAFVVACLWLGWWQLQRYRSTSGSLQNLGYTLQWPIFAAFAVFMVWRLRKLERQRRTGRPEHPRPARLPAPPRRIAVSDEADDELAAYNRYLAELNARSNTEEQDRGR